MGKAIILFLAFNSLLAIEGMPKVGQGLLEYYWLDVYQMEYYRSQNKDSDALKIIYKMDFEQERLHQGWDYGFKNNLKNDLSQFSSQIQWIKQNTPSKVKEEDVLLIKRIKGEVTIKFNQKTVASTKDVNVAKIIFLPWNGPEPVDKDLKKELFGLN